VPKTLRWALSVTGRDAAFPASTTIDDARCFHSTYIRRISLLQFGAAIVLDADIDWVDRRCIDANQHLPRAGVDLQQFNDLEEDSR
jgi:hypothetical protein